MISQAEFVSLQRRINQLTEEVKELREEVVRLHTALRPSRAAVVLPGVTPTGMALLSLLVRDASVHREAMIAAWGRLNDGTILEKNLDVQICKLRAALRAYGVVFPYARGGTYRLDPDDRVKVGKWLRGVTIPLPVTALPRETRKRRLAITHVAKEPA